MGAAGRLPVPDRSKRRRAGLFHVPGGRTGRSRPFHRGCPQRPGLFCDHHGIHRVPHGRLCLQLQPDRALRHSPWRHGHDPNGSGFAGVLHLLRGFGHTRSARDRIRRRRQPVSDGLYPGDGFPVTPDAVQPKAGGNGDAFVSVVNPMAFPNFLVYSTYLGGSQGEVGYGNAGDSAGNIYVTGYTLSPDFPTTGDAIEPNWGGGIDLFLTKLKPGIPGPAGVISSTYVGQRGVYSPTALVLGRDGTIYMVGSGGLGLPSTSDALQGYGGGVSDGFIMVLGK